MADFDPFDMDFDGDVDGIDFLGFDYLMRHVFRRNHERCEEPYEDDAEDHEASRGSDRSEPLS